jgi:hypothetical protein
MANLGLVLLVFAFVCFFFGSKWNPPGWNLIAVGLAFWTAAEIFGGALRLFGQH